MVKSEDLFIIVPSFFRCPISLDVMKSPVSLCTGVTYDRSSIQAWLDTGHNTCPATMQVLPSTDFVPNLTLHSLIQHWLSTSSDSHHHHLLPASPASSSSIDLPPTLLTPEAALLLLRRLKSHDPISTFRQLRHFADESHRNNKLLVDNGCVELVAGLLAASSGAIDSSKKLGMETVEAGIGLLGSILCKDLNRLSDEDEKQVLGRGFWSILLLALRKGSVDCRVDAAAVIESIFAGEVGNGLEKKAAGAVSIDTLEILLELMRLSGWEGDARAVEAGLAALLAVAGSARSIISQMAGHGGVSLLALLLQRPETSVVERAIALLEALCSCPDGRAAISTHPACVAVMVDRILKVSAAVTERAVALLWSLCCVFGKEAAREKMVKSNAAAKMLLVLQCNCPSPVRRMAVDLFKLVRQAGGSTECVSSYETKTTHIMPF